MSLDPDATGAIRRVRLDGWVGVRDERAHLQAIREALARHEAPGGTVLKDDERSRVTACWAGGLALVLKEVRKGGFRRRAADRVRGSPARRAFRAGRTLLARGIGAALPLAALERRRFGVPLRSLLVSLDLRGDPTAAESLAREPERCEAVLDALAQLLVALHRTGIRHGDLRAQHVHLAAGERGALRPRLIDLESLRFGLPPDENARLEDWAQISGSIPDAHAGRDARRAAFERYARALPFAAGSESAFEEMIRRSIRRRHLFVGA